MDPQHILFAHSMWVFERYESRDSEVRECIALIRDQLADDDPEAEQCREAFEWWASAYEVARSSRTVEELKEATRKYLCTNSERARPRYNVAQGAMKATIHRLWKNLYIARAGAGHLQLMPAILDAVTPEKDRAVMYMRELLAEIAAEGGETAEEMVDRLAPSQ